MAEDATQDRWWPAKEDFELARLLENVNSITHGERMEQLAEFRKTQPDLDTYPLWPGLAFWIKMRQEARMLTEENLQLREELRKVRADRMQRVTEGADGKA